MTDTLPNETRPIVLDELMDLPEDVDVRVELPRIEAPFLEQTASVEPAQSAAPEGTQSAQDDWSEHYDPYLGK